MTTKIASIYYAAVRAERPYGGPYEIPAVERGAPPVIVEIKDCIQVEQGPYSLGTNGRRARYVFQITGESIARDLVSQWTMSGLGMNPQCRPGIWVVRERLPLMNEDGTPQTDADQRALWRDATPEELDAMWEEDLAAAQQANYAYAQMHFTRANAVANEDQRLIPFIPEVARLGARFYGFDADWLHENSAVNVRSCPYCTKIISAKAVKCPHCNEVVNLEEYARLEVQRTALLASAKKEAQQRAQMEREQLQALS